MKVWARRGMIFDEGEGNGGLKLIELPEVVQWGLVSRHGSNGLQLIARIDGEVWRVPISKQNREVAKILNGIKKGIEKPRHYEGVSWA